jgi:hypothetical protein
MNLPSLKTVLTSRSAIGALAFVLGGSIAMLFFQEVIVKKKTEESKTTISQLQESLRATKDKLSQRERDLSVQHHVVKVEVIKPDGSKTITTTSDTIAKLADKIRVEEKQKFDSQVASLQQDYQHKLEELSIHRNPKHLDVFAGIDVKTFFSERVYAGGINYNLWGPFTIGVMANSRGEISPLVGIRF